MTCTNYKMSAWINMYVILSVLMTFMLTEWILWNMTQHQTIPNDTKPESETFTEAAIFHQIQSNLIEIFFRTKRRIGWTVNEWSSRLWKKMARKKSVLKMHHTEQHVREHVQPTISLNQSQITSVTKKKHTNK